MTGTEKNPGAKLMGRFAVEFEVANLTDVTLAEAGVLAPEKVRRAKIQGIVDCGATRLVLPQSVAKALGLKKTGTVTVKYADGRTAIRPTAQGVQVDLLGRRSIFTASIEPRRQTALIGAVVLEDLDFLVDSTPQRLVPRDPKTIISEEE
ncbi:MAG TPA: retroviral-like aspartic protease family protein [Planctomycetaceae bacterium]|nr:retroviral-like aspartic protease family protein [Planctomycetaceae bacterium]